MFSFIETRLFTKLVLDYLSDDAYAALQDALMRDPEAGPVLLRAPRERRDLDVKTMYPKNVTENISAEVLRQIKKEVDDG